jgi:hypothetical protein
VGSSALVRLVGANSSGPGLDSRPKVTVGVRVALAAFVAFVGFVLPTIIAVAMVVVVKNTL